jgi:hypothetical protein
MIVGDAGLKEMVAGKGVEVKRQAREATGG